MTREQRDLSVLAKIRDYCDGINDSMVRFGKDIIALQSDVDYQDSVAMKILQIGELSGRLSEEFRLSHPRMLWSEMKAMRNLAAHEYEDFNLNRVWDTINEDIPVLRDFCQRIIEQESENVN
jgi:uncharacterized protein with HEPN domain